MEDPKIPNVFYVAAYIRLSIEDGDKQESDSVQNQRKLIMNFIDSHDEFVLYDIFIDDGFTGLNFNRPDFKRMMNVIDGKKANCVMVKDLSRFGRDYIETGRYLERHFPENDIRFVAILDNIDSHKQAYDMMLPIKNVFNEQYARDISRKVYASVKTKQSAGEFIGAFPSYGYKKSPLDKNKLIIDEYAAGVVRRIFSLYLQGMGKLTIAKLLNSEGIPCPSEYKKLNGENYHNANRLEKTNYWTFSTINNLLHREMYIGNMVQGTKHQKMRGRQRKLPKENWIIVPNTHEPIIDLETWEKVQHLLKVQHRNLDFTNQSIFSGFVKCADCGRSLLKNSWRLADNSSTFVFNCSTYKKLGKGYCTPHSVPLQVVEKVVLDDLNTIIQNIENLQEIIQSQAPEKAQIRKSVEVEIFRLKSDLEKIRRHKKSLYEDYKEGILSREEMFEYREDYQKKEDFLSSQLDSLEAQYTENIETDIFNHPWIKRLLELKRIENLDRNIVVEMIDQITVYEDRKLKIRYNFSNELALLFPDTTDTQTEQEII